MLDSSAAPEVGKNPMPEVSDRVEKRMRFVPSPGNSFSRSSRTPLTASEPSTSINAVFSGMVNRLP